jgi:hypothetical protein
VHISQPALSRQIHNLEIELGLRLFDRVGRRIRLTPEGEDLLERSRDVLLGPKRSANGHGSSLLAQWAAFVSAQRRRPSRASWLDFWLNTGVRGRVLR